MKKILLIGLFILLLVTPIVLASAPNPKGLVYCCPEGVNEAKIIEDLRIETASWDDGYGCYDDNGNDIDCQEKIEKYISSETQRIRIEIEKNMKLCQDEFEERMSKYKEMIDFTCQSNYPIYNYENLKLYNDPYAYKDILKEFQDPEIYNLEPQIQRELIAVRTSCEETNSNMNCKKKCELVDNSINYQEKWNCEAECDEEFSFTQEYNACTFNSFSYKYCWLSGYVMARVGETCKYIDPNQGYYAKYTIAQPKIMPVGDIIKTCSQGMIYNSATGNCDPIETGTSSFKINLDSKIYKQETGFITGTFTHICEGDCPGTTPNIKIESKDSTASFRYKLLDDSNQRLSNDNSDIKFKIELQYYNPLVHGFEPIKVYVYGEKQDVQEFVFLPKGISNVNIIPSKKTFRNDEIITVNVNVDGPQNVEYTYVLSSVLDAEFIIDGDEEPILAIVSNQGNELEFLYKPPVISRTVRTQDFYLDELGQWSLEVGSSALRGLSGGLLAHGLGTQLAGKNVAGYSATYDGVGKAVTSADSLLTWGMDGFLPASYSALALIGDKASAGVAIGDIGYKSYEAYKRADERFKVFANTQEHEYNVPIYVEVKAEGYPPIKKAINVTVIAPEAIVK